MAVRWAVGRGARSAILGGAAAAVLVSACVVVHPEYGVARVDAPQLLIGQAPPPPRLDPVPPIPVQDATWVPGHWAWSSPGRQWSWMPGRYEVRPGMVWIPPRYERREGGWVFLRGHWRPR